MTIASQSRIAGPFTGTGLLVSYPFAFKVFTTADLQIQQTDTSGTLTLWTLGANYTVVLNSDQNVSPGGTITPLVALPAGYVLNVTSAVPLTQGASLTNAGGFFPKTIEDALDRLTILIQQALGTITGALRVPEIGGISTLPAAALRANNLLSFNSNGDPIAVAPASGSSAALATSLASTLPGLGAALSGSNDAANYFNGTTVEAILQEIGNPKGQLQLDGVNVLRYIPPAEWAAIMNGTSATDLKTYLQAALTAEPNLIFPDGRFNTSVKLIPRIDSTIRGINRRATLLRATAAITLLEYPINNVDCIVEKILFVASVSGATGIASANTAGSNHDYLIRPHVRYCDFAWDLAFGINAPLIYATIELSTFGYYGTLGAQPAPGASTMVAIRSYVVTNGTTNAPNLNRVNDCNISAGSLTQAAVDISGGTGWHFNNVDWSFGGQALATNNVSLCRLTGTCWFEGNVATNQIIDIGPCVVPVDFDSVNLTNNTAARIIRYPSSSASLSVKRCIFAFNGAAGFPLFDSTTVSNLLPANGCVEWYSNQVINGDATNKVVTGTEFRGGKTSPRLTMTGITTTPGTISSKSDPGLTISFNGVGDVSITASHPFATTVANVLPIATPQVGFQARVLVISTTQVRVQIQTAAGAAADGAFGLVVYGS